jgi:hypothetical protein
MPKTSKSSKRLNAAQRFGTYVPRGMGVSRALPASMMVTHRYGDFATVTSSGGAANTAGTPQIYLLNSIAAPGGSTAHQPYLRDQWAAFYAKYKVHRVRALITVIPYGPSLADTSVLQSALCHSTIVPGDAFSLVNQSTQAVLEKDLAGIFLPSAAPVTHKITWDIAQICGITKQQFEANIEDYAAANGSSPNKAVVFQLAAMGMFAVSKSVGYTVVFEYDTEWFETVIQSTS